MKVFTWEFLILTVYWNVGLTFQAHGDELGWNYGNGPGGPASWYTTYPDCGKSHQSPIDIPTFEVECAHHLTPIVLTGFDRNNMQMNLTNNGRTAVLTLPDKQLSVTTGGIKFWTRQLHFHWGLDDTEGSEHSIGGHKYPLEMHVVSYNAKYGTLSEAATEGDGLSVLATFFQFSSQSNPGLLSIGKSLENIRYLGLTENVALLKVRNLLPPSSELRNYYRYSGSLTTPGCFESVQWTVFKKPNDVTTAELMKFRALVENKPPLIQTHSTTQAHNTAGDPIGNNFRPQQPLYTRTVLESNCDSFALALQAPCVLVYTFFVLVVGLAV